MLRIKFNLAPPLLSKRDPVTGHLQKREYGAGMLRNFALLSKFKGLCGTALDPFGYTAERKTERQLIEDYIALIEQILPEATGPKAPTALQLVSLPDMVRGYGHVKERNLGIFETRKAELLETFSR